LRRGIAYRPSFAPLALQGSTASVLAGVGCGGAVILLQLAASKFARQRAMALLALLALAASVAGMMLQRYLASGKFMPAGMVTLLSTGMALLYLVRVYAAFTGKAGGKGPQPAQRAAAPASQGKRSR
jgi:uncharacterized membrane protein (UPF0136 family)